MNMMMYGTNHLIKFIKKIIKGFKEFNIHISPLFHNFETILFILQDYPKRLPFKKGERVKISSCFMMTQESHPGWWTYRNLIMNPNSKARIYNIKI